MDFSKDIFLAFIEEDNEQHSLFHIRPLLGSRGPVPKHIIASFKDNGFLRVAPDKKEQFTFKDRMRSLGSLCIIDLLDVEDEAGKIRPNRNYAPQYGETHQFIIYSDVVKPLPDNLVYEVIAGEEGKPTQDCTTPMCFLRSGGRIQGPYNAKDGSPAGDIESIRPDSPRIFAISLPNGQEKLFYWADDSASQPLENKALSEENYADKKTDAQKHYKHSTSSGLAAAVGRRKRESLRSANSANKLEELLSPMEAFKTAAPKVFADDARGEEAFDYLMNIPSAQALIMRLMNVKAGENPLITSFNKQLDTLEAERLKISLQLDKLKKDKQDMFNAAIEEKSAEADRQLDEKKQELQKLCDEIENIKKEHSKLMLMRDGNIEKIYAENGRAVIAKPQGEDKPAVYAVQRMREHLQNAGFAISINEAWMLLTLLLFENQVQICTATVADSLLVAETLVSSLGASSVSRLKNDDDIFCVAGGNGFAAAIVSHGARDASPFTRIIPADKMQPFGKSYNYALWPCFCISAEESKLSYTDFLPRESAFSADHLRNTLLSEKMASMPQEAADILKTVTKNMRALPLSLINRTVNSILLTAPHLSGGIASALDLNIAAYLLPYALFSCESLNIPKQILPSLPYTSKVL